MAFPSTVNPRLISGLPGRLAYYGPNRGGVAIINSLDPANNIFGRFLTYRDNNVETVQAGGIGALAGVLQYPEVRANNALGGVNNFTPVDFLIEGEIYVALGSIAGAVLDAPIYFTTTGVITPVSTGNTVIPGGKIVRHLPSVETPNLA